MATTIVHNNIQSVLEESSAVYSLLVDAGGHPNMDYASYCCHLSLNRFKKLLNNPDLTVEQLEGLLRKAARRHAQREPGMDWARFMAGYITDYANFNETTIN